MTSSHNVPVCLECGAVLEGLVRESELLDVERELRTKRAAITRLNNELAEKRQKQQDHATIMEVVEHWRAACNHPRTVVEPGGKIATCVSDRLDGGSSVERLKRSIDGYAAFPFVGPKGRQAVAGNGTKRFDSLELICRNDEQVARGLALADRIGAGEDG